jgi:lactate oxidase
LQSLTRRNRLAEFPQNDFFGENAMSPSRREFVTAFGAAALLAGARPNMARGQTPPVPPAEIAPASAEEGDLKIVNFDLLEEQAKKILAPGHFAFMGPSGDGWTYRENRRAFNDFPINPRRLQGVSSESIDLRTKLLVACFNQFERF